MANNNTKEKNDRFKVLRIIKNIILGTMIVLLTLILITAIVSRVNGNTPSVFGFSLFRVSSGSMAPELEVGDVILVKECDGMDVKKDDIVTYKATAGEMAGYLITHRVIKEPYQDKGEYYVVTKGDANNDADTPVNVEKIEGKLQFKIGILNYIFNFFITPWGLLTIIALIILAFFNEIILFFKAVLGIGVKEKPNIEEIIERYERQNTENQADSQGVITEKSNEQDIEAKETEEK